MSLGFTDEDLIINEQRYYQQLASGNSYFELDKVSSLNFGIIMTALPKRVSPTRDVEEIAIPGRHGTLTIDRNRYNNTRVTYSCAFIPKHDGSFYNNLYYDAAAKIADFLKPTAAYRRLENSYEPQLFQLARVVVGPTIESIMDKAGVFDVTFDCMPQRFTWLGEQKRGFIHSGDVICNWDQPSEPIITVYGKGNNTLTVGSTVIQILDLQDQLTIDCSMKNAYRKREDGSIENANRKIKAEEFPVLVKGRTGISWSEGITKVDIIPRWWKL